MFFGCKRATATWAGTLMVLVAGVLLWVFVGDAAEAHLPLQVTRESASEWVKKANQSSGYTVELNELVFAELKKQIDTPVKRADYRKALKRMQAYDKMLKAHFEAHRLPDGLRAIPLVESRYLNEASASAVGIWGFLVGTARQFGLKVKTSPALESDERLNEEKETEAAACLLQKLHESLSQDWGLAILAYQEGEGHLRNRMLQRPGASAWQLEENSKRRSSYLAKVMAALILLKNPQIFENFP